MRTPTLPPRRSRTAHVVATAGLADREPRVGRWVLLVCLATGLTTLLDSAMLNVAVPALRVHLGAGTSELQWVLAGYSLTFGLALIPGGRLGDARGRRGLLVGGLVLFSLSSLIGATASEPVVLVLARLLQGVGAGTANPQVIGLIQDHFTGPARTRALGAYAAVGAFASVIAPLVGGMVLGVAGPELGWRLVVCLNLPLGLATAWFAWRTVPSVEGLPRTASLDLPGLGLLTLVTLGLLLPFVQGDRSWRAQLPWAVLAVVAALLLLWWERGYRRRGHVPILMPELVRSRGFVLGCLVATFKFGSGLGYGVVLVVFLQEGAGLTPLQAGLVTTPGAIVSGVTAALSWRLAGRHGRTGVTVGLVAVAGVSALTIPGVLALPPSWTVPVLGASQLLVGAAYGLTMSPNQAMTLEHAPPGAHGVAAGFLQISQRISATVCIAALTGTFLGTVVPGAAESYRHGLAVVLGVTVALAAAAAACSALAPVPGRRG